MISKDAALLVEADWLPFAVIPTRLHASNKSLTHLLIVSAEITLHGLPYVMIILVTLSSNVASFTFCADTLLYNLKHTFFYFHMLWNTKWLIFLLFLERFKTPFGPKVAFSLLMRFSLWRIIKMYLLFNLLITTGKLPNSKAILFQNILTWYWHPKCTLFWVLLVWYWINLSHIWKQVGCFWRIT